MASDSTQSPFSSPLLFDELPQRERYQWMIRAVVPRPIAWVSTCDEQGRPNLAPFSFFGAVSSDPAIVSVSFAYAGARDGAIRKKDTLINIEKTGELVINIADESLAPALNQTAAAFPYGTNEFKEAGLTEVASVRVRPPRVKEAPVQMECTVYEMIPIGKPGSGASVLVLAQIRVMHLNAPDALDRLRPLSRLGGNGYGKTRESFELERPT